MKPCKVEFQAFGPYAGYELVDFEKLAAKGLFLICGKTGTGKTMILDAITLALYGKSSGHGRDDFEAMRCTNAAFDATTFVRFEFENNGNYYRFERRLERKRKNLSASYMVWQKDDNGTWTALFENAKEKMLNEKAEEIIGLSYEQFRQVIVLPQGQFEKLLTSDSADKEKILTSIFGEEKWQAIAQLMFEEATERRQQLKNLQEQIRNSLQEEACETLEELEGRIKEKRESLAAMETAYQESAYEKQSKELRDKLALVSRFQDLQKEKARVRAYEEKLPERAAQEKRSSDARRAEKVRALLAELHTAETAWTQRKTAAQAAEQEAMLAKQNAEQVLAQVTAQQEKNAEIEEKKARKIQYEAKTADYESIAVLEQAYQKQQKEAEMALQEAKRAEQSYESYAPKLVALHKAYETDMKEHQNLLAAYLAGITGELAASLVEGQPCPVCGSRQHPQKAVRTEADTSKERVEEKRAEADAVYQKLQQTMQKQEQAKKQYEEKQRLAQELQLAKETAYTRLAEMKNNLIPEIGSLAELQKKLQQLTDEISKDTEKLQSLTKKLEQANNTVAETEAKAELARQEEELAKKKQEAAMQAVTKGLSEHGFSDAKEAERLLLSEKELEELQQQIADFDAGKKAAEEQVKHLQEELGRQQEPDAEACKTELARLEKQQETYAKETAVLAETIRRLSQKAEKLALAGEGLEEKLLEAEQDLAFAKKLRGDAGTGLQRYVLGVLFSSVIAAANRMLSMVHGGRYRLFRSDEKAQGSNKRGLELKVYDKNSEEHEGRFVSTLSGGEKFLASLALSIGMSTIAQKSGIRIEALFIDEGFGSLDEDSITDAMQILDSIQQANGLVGIISHVQLLQERIPTKLCVEETEKGSHIIQTIG
ncbi:SMC family ATPase [Kineothrix sp. MSJ-39]|uniref:AAA family ATPase n=1 Tax=Kineothrix sp. MSJ-39 TaxID=2841533 RepID=UPI001C11E97B|nr:SMC family ATPase [Kineothrix sp. MSJ-39]MBU5430533.1 SMC family ATPase [Kineothrix sp. MSJ-39]